MLQLDSESNRMCHKWQTLIQICDCIIVSHERQQQNTVIKISLCCEEAVLL